LSAPLKGESYKRGTCWGTLEQFEPEFKPRTNLMALQNSKDWHQAGAMNIAQGVRGSWLLNTLDDQMTWPGCPVEEAGLLFWQGKILAREKTQRGLYYTS
jgi:hypothetical protein